MAENEDYDPGPFRTHDFSQERRNYQSFAHERVSEAKAKGEPVSSLIPTSISTNCPWPLLLGTDVTGSVGKEWLSIFFSKFPYLFIEGKEYMGSQMEVCFGAIGDLYPSASGCGAGDKYFLQALSFIQAEKATETIKKLIPEGGGGGQAKENYELFALYVLKNIFFPKARRKPLLIFNGDEAPYESVSRQIASRINVTLDGEISTAEIFRQLKQKCTVYITRKPYGNYEEHDIHRAWVKLLGDSHVCILQSPERVVDVIFGIMAKETGKIQYFKDELTGRQTADQCKEVLGILEPIFADETPDDMPIESESDDGQEASPLV